MPNRPRNEENISEKRNCYKNQRAKFEKDMKGGQTDPKKRNASLSIIKFRGQGEIIPNYMTKRIALKDFVYKNLRIF